MRHNVIALLLACIITTTAHGASAGADAKSEFDLSALSAAFDDIAAAPALAVDSSDAQLQAIAGIFKKLIKVLNTFERKVEGNPYHELLNDPAYFTMTQKALSLVMPLIQQSQVFLTSNPDLSNPHQQLICKSLLELAITVGVVGQTMVQSLQLSYPEEVAALLALITPALTEIEKFWDILLALSCKETISPEDLDAFVKDVSAEGITLDTIMRTLEPRMPEIMAIAQILHQKMNADPRVEPEALAYLQRSAERGQAMRAPSGLPSAFASEAEALAALHAADARDAQATASALAGKKRGRSSAASAASAPCADADDSDEDDESTMPARSATQEAARHRAFEKVMATRAARDQEAQRRLDASMSVAGGTGSASTAPTAVQSSEEPQAPDTAQL
jgi:hypothetical protein